MCSHALQTALEFVVVDERVAIGYVSTQPSFYSIWFESLHADDSLSVDVTEAGACDAIG